MISLSQQTTTTFTEEDRVKLCGDDEKKQKMKTKGIQMKKIKGEEKQMRCTRVGDTSQGFGKPEEVIDKEEE